MNTFNPLSIQSFFLFFLVSLTPVTISFVVEFIRSLVRPASPPSTEPPVPPTPPQCECGDCDPCQKAFTKWLDEWQMEEDKAREKGGFNGEDDEDCYDPCLYTQNLGSSDDHCPKFGDCQGCDSCDQEEQFIPPYSSDSAPFC